MTHRWLRPALITVISVVCTLGSLTSGAFAQDAGSRGVLPEWGMSLTQEQGRQLQDRIVQLSNQLQIRNATITAIARRLGARPGISFDDLIQAVDDAASEAADLRAEIVELHTVVAGLEGGDTASLLASLERAELAFDQGRLHEAEQELATLDRVRSIQAAGSNEAWLKVVSARARLARLSGSGLSALRLLDAAQAQVDETTWVIQFERALTLHDMAVRGSEDPQVTLEEGGFKLNGRSLYEMTLEAFKEDVLPAADPIRQPIQRARTLYWIATLSDNRDDVIARSEEALAIVSPEMSDIDWAVGNLLRGRGYVGGATTFDLASDEEFRWPQPTLSELETAVSSLEIAASIIRLNYFVGCWPESRWLLADARRALAERTGDREMLISARARLVRDLEEQGNDPVIGGHASCCEPLWEVLWSLNEALRPYGLPEIWPSDPEPLSDEALELDEAAWSWDQGDPLAGCPDLPRPEA